MLWILCRCCFYVLYRRPYYIPTLLYSDSIFFPINQGNLTKKENYLQYFLLKHRVIAVKHISVDSTKYELEKKGCILMIFYGK